MLGDKLTDFALVLAGGAMGSALRYVVTLLPHGGNTTFPLKTLFVNALGCFLIGLIAIYIQHHIHQQLIALFLITGFLGGFTTFSTFSYETAVLLHDGYIRTAILNILISTGLGLISVAAGMLAGMYIR